MSSKLKYLVIDSGAFIQKQPLWNHAEELYSIPEVLDEIRDVQTRQFVESFPVKVNFCQPQPSSLKFITDFSKKSGDFHVLSVTDLKLLALTYELEVRENGSEHLRKEPLKKVTNITVTVPVAQLNSSEQRKDCDNDESSLDAIEECAETEKLEDDDIARVSGENCNEENNNEGWTTVSKKRKQRHLAQPLHETITDTASVTSAITENLDAMCSELLQILESHFSMYSYVGGYTSSPPQELAVFIMVHCCVANKNGDSTASFMFDLVGILDNPSLADLKHVWQKFCNNTWLTKFPSNTDEEQLLEKYPSIRRWLNHVLAHPWLRDASVLSSSMTKGPSIGPSVELISSLLGAADQFLILSPATRQTDSLLECDDDDDEEGWITPDNIDQMTSNGWFPVEGDEEEEEEEKGESQVTVACITVDYAMQHVLKHIKLGVLGVDGRLIHNLRNFVLRCFTCYSVTPDMSLLFCPKCGHKTLKRVSITTNPDGTQNIWISRRPLNTRGFRYNLPKPRGGQHAVMPLLTADQRFPHQWAKKAKGTNALDPDYVAGSSPFSDRDVNSRAAQHGYYPGNNSGANAHPTLKYAKIWKPKRKKTVRK